MKINKKFFASHQAAATAFTLGLIVAISGSVFASSIGTNLSIDGTGTVTGLSTLTGGYLSSASSTVNSTLVVVNGNLTTLGGGFLSQASSTVVGTLTATGALSASSTLVVAGASLLSASSTVNGTLVVVSGNLATLGGGMLSQASSTVVGNMTIGSIGADPNRLSVGTSTPVGSTFNVAGSMMVATSSATATTTVTISSGSPASTNTVGGCINLRATDGTMVRIYATTSQATSPYIGSGAANGYQNLVVERGSCQ